MKPLQDIYKASFFKRRSSLAWRVPLVCDAIVKVIPFDSILDVGCAIGDFIKGFMDRDKAAYGIEGSPTVLPYLKIELDRIALVDLRCKIKLPIKFDLAMCLEVAEHIEPEHSIRFIKNITGFSDNILISMAPPGQGGHHHVNCCEVENWDLKFKAFGFLRNDSISDKIKEEWEPYKKKKGMNAYYQNLHFYKWINS